jgi:hypothetical protein
MNEPIECQQSLTNGDVLLIGAHVEKMSIKPGDIIKLTIPKVGNRWGVPRINKLAACVRKFGGELAVIRDDGTKLEVDRGTLVETV